MGSALSQEPKNNRQNTMPIDRVQRLEPITRSDPNKSKASVWKRHWVDDESKIHCFALLARDLSITWGDDQRYWQWTVSKGEEYNVFLLKYFFPLVFFSKIRSSN
ncbi:hypothetical protein ZIOFF_072134 [Zingiber officinale]|uniref:Uncharacterized protein n=1 Tax=Zingiber officinale TaxID=94328 RepID=A0A8J5BF89_ZINOF|nr:hypothetical protein ZIOFF_072134 [Zingiber officinale]